jgi:hypothetical protein
MDLVVVFHPPQPGGCIQACKLVSPKKGPPNRGRACASLHRKACAEAPNRPPRDAYYAQTAGGSTRAPGGTMHFGELLTILFRRQGQHHHARADPARLRHIPEHKGRPW